MSAETATIAPEKDLSEYTPAELKALHAQRQADLKRIRDLRAKKEKDAEAEEIKELEALEKEFFDLIGQTVKVEVGDSFEELSLHDALFGVPRTIMVQKRNGPEGEKEERAYTAKIDGATRTALRKAIGNVGKILAGEPRRILKNK